MTDLKIVKTTYSPDFAPNFPTFIEVESKRGDWNDICSMEQRLIKYQEKLVKWVRQNKGG